MQVRDTGLHYEKDVRGIFRSSHLQHVSECMEMPSTCAAPGQGNGEWDKAPGAGKNLIPDHGTAPATGGEAWVLHTSAQPAVSSNLD